MIIMHKIMCGCTQYFWMFFLQICTCMLFISLFCGKQNKKSTHGKRKEYLIDLIFGSCFLSYILILFVSTIFKGNSYFYA